MSNSFEKETKIVEWTAELTLKFIEMYKTRTVLWDPRNINHKNKYKRQETLMEISNELGIHKNELERKIKNLTSHYYREMRKTDCMKRNRNYKSKWFAFKALDFLPSRYRWFRPPEPSEVLEIEMDNEVSKTDSIAESEAVYVSGHLPPTAHDEHYSMADVSMKLEKPVNQIKTEALSVSSSSSSWNNHRNELPDEYSLLGEEVAIKVRKLSTKYARCLVQYKIQRLLFNASLGKYDYPRNSSADPASSAVIQSTTEATIKSTATMKPTETIETVDITSESSSSTRSSPSRDNATDAVESNCATANSNCNANDDSTSSDSSSSDSDSSDSS